jgi:uncharacterized repeat protein (TIGR01451 family)
MKHTTYLFITAFMALLSCQLDAQQFFFSSVQPASCASTDGIVTIVPTQGVPPFTYLWNNGSTDVSLKNVPKGVYTATLTDATGATVVHSHILNSKAFDLYLADKKPVTNCTPNSGALTVEPVGGVTPYTFSWSNGQTSATIQGLATGTYSVTATDASGCVALGEYEVNYDFNHYPSAWIQTLQEPDCINANNGELRAYMQWSGYAPYAYSWSNGATTESVSGLATGNYSVTVTDALGCPRTATATVENALTMTGNVICSGANTGTVSALLVNATAPVNYNWSNGQTGPNLSNLSAGTYFVTATDANGCNSTNLISVKNPTLQVQDNSPKCYVGNGGAAYCWVNNDNALDYLWDNGATTNSANALSPGLHSVTVTTALGCTLVGSINVAAPVAPPIQINYTPDPADCANGTGGALNVSITGGVPPYNFYASGPNGFNANNTAALQNLAGGEYYLYVSTPFPNNCYAYTSAEVPDAGGFNPKLVIEDIDCVTGFGAAAIADVTMPGAQYNWSMGATAPDVHNLTPGIYSVTVTGVNNCVQYFEFYLYDNDTIQQNNDCFALATGRLINDLGVTGCNGVAGIPFQLIRTLPSGALNFTDANGVFNVQLPGGNFDLVPASYNLSDIACPPGGFHSVNTTVGSTVSGLDFHFYNTNSTDHRVRQRALRTAQPGFPYSLRLEVCNDGSTVNNGSMELEFGNFFGGVAGTEFTQHPGTFSLSSETAGVPNNEANFTFPGVAPGGCELLQIDFETPTTIPAGTEFITRASVTPTSGDPTPDNNVSTLLNTVVGSFDPNSVFAYPARNGNPLDGGDILKNVDRTITYQIFFQNTGTAPANLVIVRDTLDAQLNLATIRNITTSHDVNVTIEGDNEVLVFKFPNINLPDSTSDYANSIGSIQYEIDLAPNLPVGTEVEKQAAIYFDFNSPVITNNNVLKVTESSSSTSPSTSENKLAIFPNPAADYFGFYSEKGGELSIFNALGGLVAKQQVLPGLERIETANLPDGIYLVRLEAAGFVQSGKVVVNR